MIIKLERLAFVNSFYTLMSKFSGYARDIFLAYYIKNVRLIDNY